MPHHRSTNGSYENMNNDGLLRSKTNYNRQRVTESKATTSSQRYCRVIQASSSSSAKTPHEEYIPQRANQTNDQGMTSGVFPMAKDDWQLEMESNKPDVPFRCHCRVVQASSSSFAEPVQAPFSFLRQNAREFYSKELVKSTSSKCSKPKTFSTSSTLSMGTLYSPPDESDISTSEHKSEKGNFSAEAKTRRFRTFIPKGISEAPTELYTGSTMSSPHSLRRIERSEEEIDGGAPSPSVGSTAGLHTLFVPNIPLPSVVGRKGSSFVDIAYGRAIVRKRGLFLSKQWVPGKRDGKEMVMSNLISGRDRYFGIQYADGTSLSYIPVAGVTISEATHRQQQPVMYCAEPTERILVAKMSMEAFRRIASTAESLIHEQERNKIKHHSFTASGVFDGMIACLSPHRSTVWAIVAGNYYEQDVFKTLKKVRVLQGVGFFALKYRRDEFEDVGNLRFEFHSMMVQRNVDAALGPFKSQTVFI